MESACDDSDDPMVVAMTMTGTADVDNDDDDDAMVIDGDEWPLHDTVGPAFRRLAQEFPFLRYQTTPGSWRLRGLSPLNLDVNIRVNFLEVEEGTSRASGATTLNDYVSRFPNVIRRVDRLDQLTVRWALLVGNGVSILSPAEMARVSDPVCKIRDTIARLSSSLVPDDEHMDCDDLDEHCNKYIRIGPRGRC